MRRTAIVALLLALPGISPGQDTFSGVKRIVAVGDVHGGYDEFVTVLRSAGVIDKSNKWTGGATHLVQTGDCVDRGAASRKVLDLLINLENQAKKAKGRVHPLIGNHEAMNMYGDLRYVSAGEYESYKTGDSAEIRDRAYDVMADPAKKGDPVYRKQWYDERPLGWVEHRQAFAANGRYGKIILERNAIVKINDLLFMHGGISKKYVSVPLADLNLKIRAELKDFKLLQGGVAMDDQGPLWYRGLANDSETELAPFVDSVLSTFGVSRVVLGHTPTAGAVVPRFGGKVILIDVGMSKHYNQSPACLLIEDGKAFAMHRGMKLAIPTGNDPGSYLKQAAAIDPPGTNLRKSLGLQ
ncbi:MAG: metallophosphoesterase [Candidatus Solibacter usitatus]|nr:metallophosphoesterase [Candidatus Solibacter usitatus]